MVEPAYSDERAEAFRAYMCLYGYKAAIDRCDWVAARRWFSEKEGERSRATARWALHCVAFATAYMVLHISMPQLVEEVPRPLRNVMDSVALTSVFAGALALVRFKEETFDDMPPSMDCAPRAKFFDEFIGAIVEKCCYLAIQSLDADVFDGFDPFIRGIFLGEHGCALDG